MAYRTIKPATPLEECERVGSGRFDPTEHQYSEKELREFLAVPFDTLQEECRRTALRPNMEELTAVDLAGSDKGAIYFWTTYKLRSGREIYHKRYFDRRLRLIAGPT